MEKHIIDISKCYSPLVYAKTFGVPQATVYLRINTGKYQTVDINGKTFIYGEQEANFKKR